MIYLHSSFGELEKLIYRIMSRWRPNKAAQSKQEVENDQPISICGGLEAGRLISP